MRRTIAFVCVLAMMAALLAGCGGGTEEVAPVQKPGGTTIKPGMPSLGTEGNQAPKEQPSGGSSGDQSSGGSFWDQAPSDQPSGNQSSGDQSSGDSFWGQQAAPSQGNYTVYVQIPAEWSEAYLWAWSTTAGDLYEAWPGEPMKKISDCWYAMDVPAEYDWIVVNNNGWDDMTSTNDICTEGKDAWIIWPDNEGYMLNTTSTWEYYDDKFESMGIEDQKQVSSYLNSLAAIRLAEDDLYMEMEFGLNSSGVQEYAFTYYYDLSDMTPAEVSEGVKNIRSGIREMFGHIGCLEIRDEIHNDILVVALHFRGMDDAANAREMVAAVSQLVGMDASGMLDRNGRVILDSVFTLEEAGADIKLR